MSIELILLRIVIENLDSLDQHCPKELSVMMEVFSICSAQNYSHYVWLLSVWNVPRMDGGTKVFILINSNLNLLCHMWQVVALLHSCRPRGWNPSSLLSGSSRSLSSPTASLVATLYHMIYSHRPKAISKILHVLANFMLLNILFLCFLCMVNSSSFFRGQFEKYLLPEAFCGLPFQN